MVISRARSALLVAAAAAAALGCRVHERNLLSVRGHPPLSAAFVEELHVLRLTQLRRAGEEGRSVHRQKLRSERRTSERPG